jgi:hypothetical protein
MESKINVTVRVKPLLTKEASQVNQQLWQKVSSNTLMNLRTKEMFSFDNVFTSEITTKQIFNEQVKDLVISSLKGINQTIFAYG